MLSEASLIRLERRAHQLSLKYGVPVARHSKGMGAYHDRREKVEYLLHEVAHWLTLGNTLKSLPRQLTRRVDSVFDGLTPLSANSLEIDTALVTFLAGHLLDLWDDPLPIAKSCNSTLHGIECMDTTARPTLEGFQKRRGFPSINRMAKELALWLRPSAKAELRPFDGDFLK